MKQVPTRGVAEDKLEQFSSSSTGETIQARSVIPVPLRAKGLTTT